MKIMKKSFLSLALALVMCLGLTVPAMAAEIVAEGGYVYELSQEPVGTVEIDEVVLTVVPDQTTIISKTDPASPLVVCYASFITIGGETGLLYGSGDDEVTSDGGSLYSIRPCTVVEPEVDEGEERVTIIENAFIELFYAENAYAEGGDMPLVRNITTESAVKAAGLEIKPNAPAALPSAPEAPAAPSSGFTDVAADAYYAAPVAWAVEKGVTTGTSATAFSPEQSCTNAQILTFLWRAYGEPEPAIGNPYANAIPDAYAKAAVWAYEKGMVSGTVFETDKPCTRAMAVTYMWQASGSPAPAASADGFTDVPADAPYAPAVAWAVEKGVTTGTSATAFSPDAICSRGQIVTFLHRDLA